MSDFTVPVVAIPFLENHPDADRIQLTEAEGCPCIVKKGAFSVGDKAVYIPVDSVISQDSVAGKTLLADGFKLSFKTYGHRVKAIRLRGIFSMGILVPLSLFGIEAEVDTDVSALLGIKKYEEIEPSSGGYLTYPLGTSNLIHGPSYLPTYGLDHYRKFGKFLDGKEVVVTEKIHGCCFTAMYDGEEFFVKSHHKYRDLAGDCVWTKTAKALNLQEKLAIHPKMAVYGEVYGRVQDLTYGAAEGEIRFAAFDVFDANCGEFLGYDEFVAFCKQIDIPVVPFLHRGPWDDELIRKLAKGTTLAGGQHFREGVVVKPTKEQYDLKFGRLALKLVSEEYLTRPGGTEYK